MPGTQPTHHDVVRRLDRGEHRFERIESEVSDTHKLLQEVQAQLGHMQSQLEAATSEIAATREIVEAWGAVKTAGKFIKWISGIVAGLAALYAAIRLDPSVLGK